jgi:type IV secretory pathway TrbD component
MRLSFFLVGISRGLPVVLGIASAKALDAVLSPWPALLVALAIWFVVDKALVDWIVKRMLLDPWQRGLLDRAADTFADHAGLALLSADLSRREGQSPNG